VVVVDPERQHLRYLDAASLFPQGRAVQPDHFKTPVWTGGRQRLTSAFRPERHSSRLDRLPVDKGRFSNSPPCVIRSTLSERRSRYHVFIGRLVRTISDHLLGRTLEAGSGILLDGSSSLGVGCAADAA
jgi:hypothetical protein